MHPVPKEDCAASAWPTTGPGGNCPVAFSPQMWRKPTTGASNGLYKPFSTRLETGKKIVFLKKTFDFPPGLV
jgi:hypothetical protein